MFKHNESDILTNFSPYADPLYYFDEISPELEFSRSSRNIAPNKLIFVEIDNVH